MKETILLLHVVSGVIGIMSTVWAFVETLSVRKENIFRLRFASIITVVSMVLTWIIGGYWYVVYYAADKAIILKGPWPFAHSVFMEVKEHLFFATLILSVYLVFITFNNDLVSNRSARTLVYVVTTLIVLSAMAIEGAGGIIAMGVKLGLLGALNAN